MPTRAELGDREVESITVQLAGLELTITARPAAQSATASVSGFEVLGSETAGVSEPAITPALEALVLATSSPLALSALPIPLQSSWLGQLRAQHPEWTGRARLARAFRAGVSAHLVLVGREGAVPSPIVPFRNAVYVVLRCRRFPHGFWTFSYKTYSDEVVDPTGFAAGSVSHAFATKAEAAAYIAGANQQWPPEV